jgi:hypothetical protein
MRQTLEVYAADDNAVDDEGKDIKIGGVEMIG